MMVYVTAAAVAAAIVLFAAMAAAPAGGRRQPRPRLVTGPRPGTRRPAWRTPPSMSDYHLHLHPHEPTPDGPPPGAYPVEYLERYVEAAAARGVTELAFTEHLGRCVESAEVLGPFWELEPDPVLRERTRDLVARDRNLSLERFVDVVLRAKDRGLPVLLGLEVDFFPHTIDAVAEFLAPYPWDLLVGAVHWIGGWTFDRPWARESYLERGVRRVWEEYFELVGAAGRLRGRRRARPPRPDQAPRLPARRGAARPVRAAGARRRRPATPPSRSPAPACASRWTRSTPPPPCSA